MRTARVALVGTGLLALVLVPPVLQRSADATFGGADPRLLALEAAVTVVLVLSAAAGVLQTSAVALGALGALWMVPELAGAWLVPLPVRTVTDTAAAALVALVVVALVLPAGRPHRPYTRPLLAAVTGLVLATITRLFLVDPFVDVGCWRTCEHNPWSLVGGAAAGRVMLILALLSLAAAAALGCAGELATRSAREDGVPTRLARLIGWALAVTLATATLVVGPAGSGGTGAATVVFVVAQLAALGWLGAMWWGWWARWRTEVRLIRLAEEMHDVSSPDALPSALRCVLRDPGLRLWYWAPGRQAFVDPRGDPVTRPEPAADEQTTTVTRDGEPVALIVHSKRIDGGRLDRAMRPALRLALQNQQLRAAAKAELAELAASRTEVVESRQVERSRLERNLHDGAQQHAFSLALLLGALLAQCGDTDRPAVARAQALTQELLDELRMVAHGIHPTVLTDAGLEGAFRDLAERSDTLPVTVGTLPKGRYPATVEAAAYLVVRELLADAVRRGAGQASVNGSTENGVLRASVEDDAPDPAGPVPIDLADQVLALGGRLVAAGTPTASRTEVAFPCGS